jgi:hypothetical protein
LCDVRVHPLQVRRTHTWSPQSDCSSLTSANAQLRTTRSLPNLFVQRLNYTESPFYVTWVAAAGRGRGACKAPISHRNAISETASSKRLSAMMHNCQHMYKSAVLERVALFSVIRASFSCSVCKTLVISADHHISHSICRSNHLSKYA